MKSITFILLFAFAIQAQAMNSRSTLTEPVVRSKPFEHMVHFNPLALFIAGFEVGYEKAISPKQSFYVNPGYYLSEEAGLYDAQYGNQKSDMNGFKLELQYRFYRKSNNYFRNVYLAPFVLFKTFNVLDHRNTNTPNVYENVRQSASSAGFGYQLGMRNSLFENIYLDIALGGGVMVPVSGDHHSDLHINFINPLQKGVQFRMSAGVCIAL